MGNITVTRDGPPRAVGNRLVVTGQLSPSTSYAAGGESFTASMFGISRLERLTVMPALGGYLAAPDMTNSKVKIFQNAAGAGAFAEVSGNLSAQKFDFEVIGSK
jgi:hypothetical protein